MTDYHNHVQTRARPVQQLGEPAILRKGEIMETYKAIKNYKLRDELFYFRRKNRKKSPNQ